MSLVLLSLLLLFESFLEGYPGNFQVAFKRFQNLAHFKRKTAYLLPCKLRIAQCKQSRLVKPLLNFDLNFIFKSSGTALLETVFSY